MSERTTHITSAVKTTGTRTYDILLVLSGGKWNGKSELFDDITFLIYFGAGRGISAKLIQLQGTSERPESDVIDIGRDIINHRNVPRFVIKSDLQNLITRLLPDLWQRHTQFIKDRQNT